MTLRPAFFLLHFITTLTPNSPTPLNMTWFTPEALYLMQWAKHWRIYSGNVNIWDIFCLQSEWNVRRSLTLCLSEHISLVFPTLNSSSNIYPSSPSPLLCEAKLSAVESSNCMCRTPCNMTRYNKELSMVKIPSKTSARYLQKKFNKSEKYIT